MRRPTGPWPRHLGLDWSKEEPIPFDSTDPAFLEAYFQYLHHPNEAMGVDFWWVDWQQGTHTRIPGLDPLWMLNHYHYLDSMRGGKRGLTFSRYSGPGQPPLPHRLLGGYHHLVEVAGFPALLHRQRQQHRLRLVEP